MPAIHEQATLTSKGQITLPKSIRQALGVNTGEKVVFEKMLERGNPPDDWESLVPESRSNWLKKE